MDENLLSLLEELSLRSCSEDENCLKDEATNHNGSNYTSNIEVEDLELKNAVNSLFHDLRPTSASRTGCSSSSEGYDKSKLLVALLGNIDLVTCAVKKINQLVSLGKKMEQIYRRYYIDPNVPLDLEEINQLISAFTNIYNSETYIREVNVSRVYQAYCRKLIEIYNSRMTKEEPKSVITFIN